LDGNRMSELPFELVELTKLKHFSYDEDLIEEEDFPQQLRDIRGIHINDVKQS